MAKQIESRVNRLFIDQESRVKDWREIVLDVTEVKERDLHPTCPHCGCAVVIHRKRAVDGPADHFEHKVADGCEYGR